MSDIPLTVTDAPTAEDLDVIGAGLTRYNVEAFGPTNRQPLAVLVRDETGTLRAGINGFTGWSWLYVQWLWVDASLRGQGMAARMLDAAEAEAVRRGCTGSWIDTFNPVALKVYRQQGYVEFGRIENFPVGHSRTFLQKAL